MDRQRLHSGNVLLKFDLHHSIEDSAAAAGNSGALPSDDSDGCLLSCFPTCQIPRYYAGQMITGHLMIRPVSRIIISGVTLSFGGRCETGWREGCTKWTGKRVFFLERRHLIENRLIPLDCKWHRFDFEYRIPPQLPPSIEEKEGRYTYYGTAIILQPHGADIETHEARFRLSGRLDVDSLPGWLRSSVERKEEMYRSVVDDFPSSSTAGGRAAAPQHQQQQLPSDNDSASVFLNDPEDDSILISAGLCLNRRIFVPGDRMVAEGTVSNRTSTAVVCSVKFQQVLAFFADYGLEKRGRRSPLYQHYRSNMRLVVRDLVTSSSSSSLVIQPGKTRGFACSFDVPKVPPSTLASLAQPITEMSNDSRQDVMVFDDREPLIRYKYFCKLVVISQWSRPNEMVIPIEVKIGSHRSLKLTTITPASATSRRSSRRSSGAAAAAGGGGSSSSRDAADGGMAAQHHRRTSGSRDGGGSSSSRAAAAEPKPSIELSVFDVRNEPLNYEDYFREVLRSTSSSATTRHRIQEIPS